MPESPDRLQDSIFFDLLWADPSKARGITANSERGGGTVMFGPDVSAAFLERNNLELVIRSHEVPSTMAGWEDHHDNRVMTVPSQTNHTPIRSARCSPRATTAATMATGVGWYS